ncbi:Hypothetical protein FKW44_008194 [Caligus rogercresseyi]|uniref:Uncharacterized protein n=1 Tax=Caligus rogercresseyi TaxID=217165 RepID=A0A7T8QU41_CALRO|nr:Hypothetical protein FKW44_008194 [Caligus rogercresseyi]
MQNELNTNKYFKLAYSANRCRYAVKSGAGSVFLSEFPSRGTLPRPSTPSQSWKIRLGRFIRTP